MHRERAADGRELVDAAPDRLSCPAQHADGHDREETDVDEQRQVADQDLLGLLPRSLRCTILCCRQRQPPRRPMSRGRAGRLTGGPLVGDKLPPIGSAGGATLQGGRSGSRSSGAVDGPPTRIESPSTT